MPKLKLEPNPTFTRKVTFAAEGGDEVVTFKFKHKTRIEFAELWDEHRKNRPASVDSDDPDKIDVREVLHWQTSFLMSICEGWDVVDSNDAPVGLTSDTAFQFLNIVHDGYGAIVDAYSKGLQRAKLGN